VIDALAAVLDRWRDPDSPERRDLERDLPAATGFSAPNVREGLARGLAPWSGDALRALAERELSCGGGRFARGYDVTAVLLAGAIPMPALLSMIAPLAVRSAALVKTAAHDPITAPLVAALDRGGRSAARALRGGGRVPGLRTQRAWRSSSPRAACSRPDRTRRSTQSQRGSRRARRCCATGTGSRSRC
jgi:hypothetical protein